MIFFPFILLSFLFCWLVCLLDVNDCVVAVSIEVFVYLRKSRVRDKCPSLLMTIGRHYILIIKKVVPEEICMMLFGFQMTRFRLLKTNSTCPCTHVCSKYM